MAGNSWYGHLCLFGAGALGRVAAVIHSLRRHQVLGEGAKHVRRGETEAETTGRLEVVAWGHECSPGRSSSCVVVTERGSIPAENLTVRIEHYKP